MYYDEDKARRTLNFIKNLKHTKGKWAGVPFTTLPWQEQAIGDIFGTMRENGYRQYNTAYLEIPKKNGKSEMGAAIALYMFAADEEHSAEVYGCAADRQQASIIFDVAVDMVDQSKALKKRVKLILSQKRMVYMPTSSFYQVLSAEAYSKHGLNVSACIFDELHAQPNRQLYDVMTEGSGDARMQPLFLFLTTAGDDPDRQSIGWEVHSMAEAVLTGAKKDPTFYAMIFGLDTENKRVWTGRQHEKLKENWKSEKLWKKVNPSLNHTIDIEKVRDQFKRSEGSFPREKNFRWLRLNEWVSVKLNKWLPLDVWDRNSERFDISRLYGRRCFGGLDLSSKIDLTAFVLLFPPDDINKKWIVLPWFWIPEEAIKERSLNDKVDYIDWNNQGFIHSTPGNVIDYDFIEKTIMDLSYKFRIEEIGFDPWNATQTAIHLGEQGLTMVEVRQGARSMSPAMKEIEQLCIGRKLMHGGHPVLRWNVGNVAVKADENDNIRPVKDRKRERIDGLVAMINAMNRAIVEEDRASVYEGRDVRII